MLTGPKTLKDIKVYQDIQSVLSPFFPDRFIDVLYKHMQGNEEDLFDHEYVRDSLFVLRRLIEHTEGLSLDDLKLLYCVVALFEVGRPLSKDKPYELSPGVSWMLLRLYAPKVFNRDELNFISKACKPLKPQTLRPSHQVQLQLLVHNTKQLTDVVTFKYGKLYTTFMEGLRKPLNDKQGFQLFIDYYGKDGSHWAAVSESAKGIFSSEISKFKREVVTAVSHNL